MKTHIEIVSKNLLHNLSLFKKLTGRKIMFVVKGNAYGHGLKEIAQITRTSPLVDYYAVDSIQEALILKEASVSQPVLVIGWTDRQELEVLLGNDFETVIPSMDQLKLVNSIARKLNLTARVHAKVETGTGRMGMEPAELIRLMQDLRFSNVKMRGIYSHFANIEDTTDHSYARSQLKIFDSLLKKIKTDNIMRHFSCSASALLFPETHFDVIRVGIAAYGYWPSKQTHASYLERKGMKIDLKRVLNWYSQVIQIKNLKKGSAIGYGLTYKTYKKSKIIVVPVGYYDGYDRRLSNLAHVIVNGSQAPVRGRICMNMLMADVTHIRHPKPGDPVILIGEQNHEKVDADLLADLSGTINYEILCRLNPLIPKKIT